MSEYLNGNLIDYFSIGFSDVEKILKSLEGSYLRQSKVQERKVISEAAIFLYELVSSVDLEEVEKDFANSWIQHFIHVLGREFEGNFILRFHYFKDNYYKDPPSTVHSMISLVLAMRALETCGFQLQLSPTVWGYVERDVPSFRETLEEILDNKKPEELIDELFLLFNTIDMLNVMRESEILKDELEKFIRITTKHQTLFIEAFKISPGLKVYASDLADRINLSIYVGDLPTSLNGKSGAFLTLMELRRGINPTSYQLDKIQNPSCLHLWWIAQAWTRKNNGGKYIGILPFYQSVIDVDSVFNIVWGNTLDYNEINITEKDIENVLNFTDQDIKNHLYEYFKNHPAVTDFSRVRLEGERDKAHAGGEISDFNVEFNTGTEKIWVAIPIKSGRESKGKKKMKQDYLYQFIKPLIYFKSNNTVVFPIILLKPTLDTHELLSLVRARLGLPIQVINTEHYTRFLKRENII